MKKLFAIAVLACGLGAGCTSYHSLAPGDAAGKVFLVKTTSYIFFINNSAYRCDLKGDTVSNCKALNFN